MSNIISTILLIIIVIVTSIALALIVTYQKKNKLLLSKFNDTCNVSSRSSTSIDYTPPSLNFSNIDVKKLKKICSTEVNACGKDSTCEDSVSRHAAKYPDDPLFCHKYDNENAQNLMNCYLDNYNKLHLSGNDKPSSNACTNKENYNNIENSELEKDELIIAKKAKDIFSKIRKM